MLVKNHSFVHILLPNKHLWKTVAKIFSLCFFSQASKISTSKLDSWLIRCKQILQKVLFLVTPHAHYEQTYIQTETRFQQRNVYYVTLANMQLCCFKEAARCFVSVSSYLQYYKTLSRVFHCQCYVRRLGHTDLSLRAIKCCSVVFGVTLRLLVMIISSSSPATNKFRRCDNSHQVSPTYRQHKLLSQLATVERRRVDNAQLVAALTARDEARDVGNRDFCLLHLHSTPPVKGSRSEYCHDVWQGKTRTVWLPEAENFLKICLLVSTEYTNVTDRRTPCHAPDCQELTQCGEVCVCDNRVYTL